MAFSGGFDRDSSGDSLRRLANDCLVIMCGRTGLRVGAAFLRGLDAEYAQVDQAGAGSDPNLELRRSTFYLPADREGGKPRIRAVALDLDSKTLDETGVRDRIVGSLNYTGGGAEMLWPQGYQEAAKLEQEILGVLEGAGAFGVRNFLLFHGTCGGTGSGLGSFVVDLIRRKYAHEGLSRNLVSFTVLPSGEDEGSFYRGEYEEVSTPSYYNTVLSLNTVLGVRPQGPTAGPNLRSMAVVMDNPTVARVIEERTGRAPESRTFESVNDVMARVALGFTATLRYGPTDLGNVLVHLRQQQGAPIVVPAISPLDPNDSRKPTYQLAYEAIRENVLSACGVEAIDQLYLLLRGKVPRPELRHVHDLFQTTYNARVPLYTLVERATPGYEKEILAFIQTRSTTRVFQALQQRVELNLRQGLSLRDYEAWGLSPSILRANSHALQQALAGQSRGSGNSLARL